MTNQQELTFNQVVEANKEKVYIICKIYAVAPLEPKDLFQEVVLQIWNSFSTFNNKSDVGTWIYKIALNVCYSSKLKLDKKYIKTDRIESIQFVPVDTPPDKNQQEKYQALYDCISSLNESDKSIVILYLEELPYKQIATIIGLTENHVAVKMKRIRKMLLDCITQKMK